MFLFDSQQGLENIHGKKEEAIIPSPMAKRSKAKIPRAYVRAAAVKRVTGENFLYRRLKLRPNHSVERRKKEGANNSLSVLSFLSFGG